MIITISGLHGTGKSTIAKILAEKLDYNYYSTGNAFRSLAEEFEMDLKKFTKYVEQHPEIDEQLDKKIVAMAKKGNIVIESQLAGHILSDKADFKVLLICPLEIRVKRMAERDQTLFNAKMEETIARENSERDRFYKLYKIDLSDNENIKSLHNLVIDTQDLSIEEIVELILSELPVFKE
jgi:cytidylate kinase